MTVDSDVSPCPLPDLARSVWTDLRLTSSLATVFRFLPRYIFRCRHLIVNCPHPRLFELSTVSTLFKLDSFFFNLIPTCRFVYELQDLSVQNEFILGYVRNTIYCNVGVTLSPTFRS